jgi:hypothetical protein
VYFEEARLEARRLARPKWGRHPRGVMYQWVRTQGVEFCSAVHRLSPRVARTMLVSARAAINMTPY